METEKVDIESLAEAAGRGRPLQNEELVGVDDADRSGEDCSMRR
ncbi:hypothetical protein OG948_02715 [Embleya sp. NBC_00888]|nr:hypothetical protein OG948_02715 [Embleya sp. NBC_00888]